MGVRPFLFSEQKKVFIHGDLARCLLRGKKLKQKQIAKLLRISPAQLSKILDKKFPADAVTFAGIAKILGLDDPKILISSEARDE